MSNANNDVKQKAKEKNVKLWQIADRLGVLDTNFSRKLRKELTQDEKDRIYGIIDELSAE